MASDITMPTALWEKLEDIAGRLGGIEAKVDGCNEAIQQTSDYQHVQNGNLARALEEVGKVRDSVISTQAASLAATAAATSATNAATLAAAEIARLREAAAAQEGRSKGVGITWKLIAAAFGLVIATITPALLIAHMIWG